MARRGHSALKKPIEIGGFYLDEFGARPMSDKIKPTKHGWVAAASFAKVVEVAAPYWVGDLLNWLEKTSQWDDDTIQQLMAETGYERQVLYNMKSVTSKVDEDARELSPSFSHTRTVAALSPKQQKVVLTKARDEELTVSQTAKLVQKISRPRIVEGQAELKGKFRVILADPPWKYTNDRAMPDGALTPAADSFPPMDVDAICALPVELHAMTDAVLFMWSTNAHLREALQVIAAWGFEYKTNFCWDKVLGRPGPYGYMHHELMLLGTRGACTPDVVIEKHDHASVMVERRSGEHSEKPECSYKRIEALYTEGPYLELFARKKRRGWKAFGNDARLWKAS